MAGTIAITAGGSAYLGRRALELLASWRDGCTEAIMRAHGFTVAQMVDLVRDGLATAHSQRVVVGRRTVEIAHSEDLRDNYVIDI